VGLADAVWQAIERHLHVFRIERSGEGTPEQIVFEFQDLFVWFVWFVCYLFVLFVLFVCFVLVLFCLFTVIFQFSAQLTPAAFGREHLLSERWLLGSSSKGADGIWHNVLEVQPGKQELFMARILFLHKLAVGRVSVQATSALRLSSEAWETEVELACLGYHCLEAMRNAKDSNGDALFAQDLLDACRGRYLEGFFVLISIFGTLRLTFGENDVDPGPTKFQLHSAPPPNLKFCVFPTTSTFFAGCFSFEAQGFHQ